MPPCLLGGNSWLVATICAVAVHDGMLLSTRPSVMLFAARRSRRQIHTCAAHRRQRPAPQQQHHHRASHNPPQTHTITIRSTRSLGCSSCICFGTCASIDRPPALHYHRIVSKFALTDILESSECPKLVATVCAP